jgi:hypothetical protein
MALERVELWWLPALYLQRSEFSPLPTRDEMLRRGLELARAQGGRALEQRIYASSAAKSV